MQIELQELRKIHDAMPKYYADSIKEYKSYLEKYSIAYLTRRKHMKRFILEKLTEKGFEITESTNNAVVEISKACKIYAIENNCADLFEILLCGNSNITYAYINAMNSLQMAKKYQPLMRDVKLELKQLEESIKECKKNADAKLNKGIEK